jgi:hypothetical protein
MQPQTKTRTRDWEETGKRRLRDRPYRRGFVVLLEGKDGTLTNETGTFLSGLKGLLHQPLDNWVYVDKIQTYRVLSDER